MTRKRKESVAHMQEMLTERRIADEKDKVVVGCMVFISVVMVMMFIHGVARSDATEFGVLFVLRCLGYFVCLSLPLLIWNTFRYVRYIDKRRHQADFYVLKEVVGDYYEDHDTLAELKDDESEWCDFCDFFEYDTEDLAARTRANAEQVESELSQVCVELDKMGKSGEKFQEFSAKMRCAYL